MIETVRDDGLTEVRRTYSTFVDGRPVIVHNVPYLYDLEEDRYLLSPQVANELFQLIRNPVRRKQIVSADIYTWEGTDAPVPKLAIRFAGRGFEYGETPISQFANAIDRVRSGSSGLIESLRKIEGVKSKSSNPFTSEPRVAYIGSGSLVVALEAPQEGLFPEETEQHFVESSIDLLVDAVVWITEDTSIPESLTDSTLRATTLKHLQRMLPSKAEKHSEVEFSGREVMERLGRPVRMFAETKSKVQELFLGAVAEIDKGESVRLQGSLQAVDLNGKATVKDVEDWDQKKLNLRFDKDDDDLVRDIKFLLGQKVLISGVLQRKADNQPKHINMKFIEKVDD